MNDDTVRLAMIGRVFRGRWRLLLALAIVGAIVGAGASLIFSPGYRTTASVLLQGTREADELETQTQVATSSVVLGRAAGALGWGVSGEELADSVNATVLDGNVIQISGAADTPERAQLLADQVANEYVAFSTKLATAVTDSSEQLFREQQEALAEEVQRATEEITALHEAAARDDFVDSVRARTELQALREALNAAMTTLDEAVVQSSDSGVVVMGPAARPTGEAAPTWWQLVAGGALVAIVLGVFGQLLAARSDRRLRRDSDIGAALGTTVLATVTQPDQTRAEYRVETAARHPRWTAWLRQVLRLDRSWADPVPSAAENDHDRRVRYRRLAQRLRASDGSLRLSLLVSEDDPVAWCAAARLAVATVGDGRRGAEVLTDLPDFERVLEAVGAEPGQPGTPVVRAGGDRPGGGNVVRVDSVSATLPIVPDADTSSGVVVMVTAGTRTGWELAEIAQAADDAGTRIDGVVVVFRSRPGGRGTPVAGMAHSDGTGTPEDGPSRTTTDAKAGVR